MQATVSTSLESKFKIMNHRKLEPYLSLDMQVEVDVFQIEYGIDPKHENTQPA